MNILRTVKFLGVVAALSFSGLAPNTNTFIVRVVGQEMVNAPTPFHSKSLSGSVLNYGIGAVVVISHERDEIHPIFFVESLVGCASLGTDCQTNARAPKQSRTRNKGPPGLKMDGCMCCPSCKKL